MESETPPIRADWRPRRTGKRCALYQAVGLAAGVRAEISLSRGACQVPVEWVGWKPISVLMASMAALEWALPVRRPVTWGSSSRGHLHISAFELFGDALAPVGGSTTVLHCQGALGPVPVDEHLGGAGRVLDEVEGRVRG